MAQRVFYIALTRTYQVTAASPSDALEAALNSRAIEDNEIMFHVGEAGELDDTVLKGTLKLVNDKMEVQ